MMDVSREGGGDLAIDRAEEQGLVRGCWIYMSYS